MKIQEHPQINRQPPPKLNKHSRNQQHINQHRRQQQRQQRPLMIIIRHKPIRPHTQKVPPQLNHLLPKRFLHLRRRIPTPPAIRPQRGKIPIELRERPRYKHCDCRGEDQPWRAPEGTFGNGGETAECVGVTGLFEGFERADVTCEKRKNRHSYAALPRDAEDGPL